MSPPFRALALALLLMAVPVAAARQAPGVLHIKVMVVDAAGKETPVPRYLLLISDNPPSAPPRRVFTSANGTADVKLPPGNYTIESDQPFVLQGKWYQWTQMIDMPAGRDAALELTALNSDAGAASGESTPAGGGPSSVLAAWQGSVVSVWTPTAFGSAFAIDPRGLVATSRRVVGSSASAEVQITPTLKVSARVLATDAVRDVAILWIDQGALQSVLPVPLECDSATKAPARGDEILALGTNARQEKRVTSGKVNGTAAHLVPTTLMLSPGSGGGPVFLPSGALAGLSTTFAEDEQASGESRVVPAADICAVLASADTKIKEVPAPDATPLPVEPASRFSEAALIEAAKRNPSLTPYRLSSSGFDVAFITPAMIHASRNESEDDRRRRKQRNAPRNSGPEPRLDPLENFSNWSSYLGDVPPVLLVRVTPRLVEGFWTRVARGAAQTQGVSIPPIKRFKPGFSHLRAFCGAAEVTPIHPFKLEQRVTETEAIYEGLYAFAPGALSSSCAGVKLTFYTDKDQNGDTRVVDPKLLQQIDEEFASYGKR